MVACGNIAEDKLTEIDAARLMVKTQRENAARSSTKKIGATMLEVRNYSLPHHFLNVNFSLKRGEILGFTGLLGDGRSMLFQSIFGVLKGATGMVKLDGKVVKIKSTKDALKSGIGYVPSNRKENGIIKDLAIVENLTLTVLKETQTPLFA